MPTPRQLVLLLLTAVGASIAGPSSGYKTINSTFGADALRYKTWDADSAFPCNGGSRHHAGWADLDDRHIFFCMPLPPPKHGKSC
jgi:cathepsin A (carboxypeptidase C)